MSFMSDFFEGNWDNLGTDISHTFSSLARHPMEIAEIGAAALTIGSLGFLGPEAFGALGAAEGAGALGAESAAEFGGLAGDAFLGADLAAGGAEAAGGLGLGEVALGGELGGELALGAGAGAELAGDVFAPGLMSFAPEFGAGGGAGFFDIAAPGADVLGAPEVAGATEFGAGATDLTGTATAGITGADAAGAAPGASTAIGAPAGGAATATPAAAPAGAVAAPAAEAGGITGTLNSIISNPWTKLALAGAPLALTLGMGETQLPSGARALQSQAMQMQQAGLTDLSDARQGKLNAGQTAVLGQMRQDLTNQWRQTLYNQGVQDPTKDTRWPQIEAMIDSQVTQQTATMIQQNVQNALQETGQASQALIAIANMQFQADQAFTNNLVNATKSLGLVAGLGSAKKVTVEA